MAYLILLLELGLAYLEYVVLMPSSLAEPRFHSRPTPSRGSTTVLDLFVLLHMINIVCLDSKLV